MKNVVHISIAILVFLMVSNSALGTIVLFSEDFDGYSSSNPGIPEISEGADEF